MPSSEPSMGQDIKAAFLQTSFIDFSVIDVYVDAYNRYSKLNDYA